tara:strand:- start:49 stop:594 length:546 start_codon:yes stop_codon:yes gene_type:complete
MYILLLNLFRKYKIPDEISIIIIYYYKSIIHPIASMIKDRKITLITRYYNLDMEENRYKLEIFRSNYEDINDFIIDNEVLLYFWKLDRSFHIITNRKCGKCKKQIFNKNNSYKLVNLLNKKKCIPGFSYANYEMKTNNKILCDRCIEYMPLVGANKSGGSSRFIIRGYKSLGFKSSGKKFY